jgi:hypothetical protein
MAICGQCGTETTRIRTKFPADGARPRDECPSCAPSTFEKFTYPSDKKIWMGYEAHPNEYVKAPDGGYDRKTEYRAEQEQKLSEETEEERTNRLRAEAEKRATRRMRPMDGAELLAAVAKARMIAEWIEETDQNVN